MFTSNMSEDEKNNALPEWHEPFPEPQTIPAGWDMSALRSGPASTMEADSGAED